MTEKQTEALRLAELLDDSYLIVHHEAADVLRHLAEENKMLHQRHHDDNAEYTRVLAQRDALVEAMKFYADVGAELGRLMDQRDQLLEALNSFMYEFGDKANSATVQKARAAIKAVKGEA